MPVVVINGQVYRTDGMSQREIDEATRAMGGGRRAASPAPSAPAKKGPTDAQRRVMEDTMTPTTIFGLNRGMANQLAKGALFNFNDELSGGVSAATKGVFNAIRRGDISEVGREYTRTRDDVRVRERDWEAANPTSSMIAQMGGSLLMPGGIMGKLAKTAVGAKVAAPVAKAASKAPAWMASAARSAPGRAIGAGTVAGALAGAGEATEMGDMPASATRGGVMGGIFGGALGAGAHVARKGVQALRSQSDGEAANQAYSRVARALEDAPRYRGSELRHTPESAAREIAVARGRGNEGAAVVDLSPELQNLGAYTRRKPGTKVGNDLYDFGAERADARASVLDDRIREGITPDTGQDALRRGKALKQSHRLAAEKYEGVVNDNAPVKWSGDLQSIVSSDMPLMKEAFSAAKTMARNDGVKPEEIGLGPDMLTSFQRPTMRTFDYMRRALGDRMAALKETPATANAARQVEKQYFRLRDALAEANPEYAEHLASQRSIFEMERGMELGKTAIKRMNKPRELHAEMAELRDNGQAFDDMRTGFVDELLNMRNSRANPVNVLSKWMKNPDQRKVLAEVFDGPANLSRFERWLRREMRASDTDAKLSGRQSITSEIEAMRQNDQSPVGEVIGKGIKGFSFGGPTGLFANVSAVLNKYQGILSDKAREELGRILMGDGQDLAKGVAAAKKANQGRIDRNNRAAKRVGKVTGYVIGSEAGD